MIRKAALIAGIVFLALGVAGFIPGITVDSEGMKKLLGLFMVDGPHNIVHILSGLVFIAASRRGNWAHLAFQAMGIVYTLVTIIGFIVGTGGSVLGLFQVNTADNFLHLALAAVFLCFGYAAKAGRTAAPAA